MIWDTSIWRLECSNHSKIRSAQNCHPCDRYDLLPMSPGQTFSFMAEREGFEPPIALRLCLISSQVHSTGLCHLSAAMVTRTSISLCLIELRFVAPAAVPRKFFNMRYLQLPAGIKTFVRVA